MRIDFCLPIKDEEIILAANVSELRSFLRDNFSGLDWRLVLLVNGSSDRSGEIAREFAARYPEKIISSEFAEGGKGRALKAWFSSSPVDILVFMDADLATSLDCLPSLLAPIIAGRADVVVGSRLLPGSQTNRRYWRSLVSHAYNLISRLVLGHSFSDLQCGFKAFKAAAFNRIAPFCQDDKWFFDTEWLMILRASGAKIEELAISWRDDRQQNRPSQVKVARDTWRFLVQLFRLRRRLKHLRIN